jgi:hypothetical protein
LSVDGIINANNGINVYNSSAYIEKDLTVNNNLEVTNSVSASSYNATSDYRIKKNIQSLDDTYTIDSLRPVSYMNTITNKQDVGLIADELQEFYPFMVSGEKDGEQLQSVNYISLIGIMIKEIKDLKKEVSLLKKEIDKMKQ